MFSSELHTGWTVRNLKGDVPAEIVNVDIPATVPGSIHTDLLDAGLIQDPYVGLNERDLQWLHTTSWRYTTTFESHQAHGGERIDLAFDGLDTVARIVVNGVEVARTANQHRYYRFDVTSLIQDGPNCLEVEFSSALEYAREQADRIGLRPRAYDHPFNMVRKMACSFGWDWGPDLQTVGMWKPVRLERWSTVRTTSSRPLVTVDEHGVGHVAVRVDLQWADSSDATTNETQPSNEAATLVVKLGAAHGVSATQATVEVPAGAASALATLEIPDVPLWWPAGYGDQPLFDLSVELVAPDGASAGVYERRIGFRTVSVNTTPDAHGTPFTVQINGRDIFVKGANWIPNDHLLTRVTRTDVEARVDQALAANMNLLRVWGGGIYETDDFYQVCDERGVMVWQDFLLACAAYPEEAPFFEEFEAEARDNVARLTPYPSLVLWNGGNENLWGFMDWGWQEELAGKTWGLDYYIGLFAQVVAELDPTRPYADGSPYSPGFTQELAHGSTTAHPNDQFHGTRHEWEVWNRQDYLTHLEFVPRFCSEFGHQGPPAWSTLARSVSPEGRSKETEEFLLHQKAESGNFKLDQGAAPHLPLPQNFEEWNWVTQLSQAHSVSFGIEHFRSFWPYTAGSVVWQLNDCWPVTSWAAVDGDGREKPLFFALKHAYAPRLLTFKPRAQGLASSTSMTQTLDGSAIGAAGTGSSGAEAEVAGTGAGAGAGAEVAGTAAGTGPIGAGPGAVVQALGAGFGEDLPHGRDALGRPTLFVVNDSDEDWTGQLSLTRETFGAEVLVRELVEIHVQARSTARIGISDDLLTPVDSSAEVLVAELGNERGFHFFEELKNLSLESHALEVLVAEGANDGQALVTFTATSLCVDAALIPDRIDPGFVVDDQLVTLRAGESRTFTVSSRESGTVSVAQQVSEALADEERAHTIVRSVNSIRVD